MLGQWIAEIWTPDVVITEEWINFLQATNYFLIISVALVYLFYLFLFPRVYRIIEYKDVFKLRRPFKLSLIIILVLQVVVDLIIGLVTISEGRFSALPSFLNWSIITGIFGVLFIWVLALIYSPPKLKYTPWCRFSFVKRIMT